MRLLIQKESRIFLQTDCPSGPRDAKSILLCILQLKISDVTLKHCSECSFYGSESFRKVWNLKFICSCKMQMENSLISFRDKERKSGALVKLGVILRRKRQKG